MKKAICTITLLLALGSFIPAISQNKSAIEKEVKALAEEFLRAYNARDISALMTCFGKPEGLIIIGGESISLDTMRVRHKYYWSNRKDESWVIENVEVIPMADNSALMQITFSGRHTWIPTGETWEFKSSAFITSLVKKTDGKWKIVAHHNAGVGKQITKP
jgi:uncharacterized protein (TIGR02246 family)